MSCEHVLLNCGKCTAERDSLRSENESLKAALAVLEPVWEAAKAWRIWLENGNGFEHGGRADDHLAAAIDTALAATEGKDEP